MNQYPFPKVELHLHLDGAIPEDTWWRIAKRDGIAMPVDTPEEFHAWLKKTAECGSVEKYLERFSLPLLIMQTKENIAEITASLIDRLAEMGYGYAEIRFAPQLHCQKELTQGDAIEAVLAGRAEALRRHPELGIGIICCCMSIGPETLNMAENLETVREAKKYLGKGVVAVDLAGCEGIVPLTNFHPIFDLCKELGIPYTIHAENPHDAVSVREVLSMGTRRIGHGHRLFDAPDLWPFARENKVTLEVCPTSNVQCQTQPSYAEHPAKKLFDAGIRVTISTDNMTFAASLLEDEYDHCLKDMGFSCNDLVRMNIYAAEALFLPEEEKEKLVRRLEAFLR